MQNSYQRKKDPISVKQKILENTEKLVAEYGVNGISLQAVADMSEVTKGGLLHHFANKQILVSAMLEFVLLKIDEYISEILAKDSHDYGCFTRAYIEICTSEYSFGKNSIWSAFCMTLITDKSYQHIWDEWLKGHLQKHLQTDSAIHLQILRSAADGIWYTENFNSSNQKHIVHLKNELIRLSYLTEN